MSGAAAKEENEDAKILLCASCGIAGGDDIILKRCNGCYLVRYCSIKCQKDHRKQHKRTCKKRAAELHDEILFKLPESNHFGDCPICCLPIPIDPQKSTSYCCCSKLICKGCEYANRVRETEGRLEMTCPFCREPLPFTEEEWNDRLMKRVEANDPAALRNFGTEKIDEGDYKAAFEYWKRAADLGDVVAHYQLSVSYRLGEVVEKDTRKELYHLEEAAIGGHQHARHNLAAREERNGQYNRAAKHLIIAAKLGYDESLAALKELYKKGFVSKEDFAAALRGHHAAVDATKSPQREEAEAAELNLAETKSEAV